jgi:hypothetical protein
MSIEQQREESVASHLSVTSTFAPAKSFVILVEKPICWNKQEELPFCVPGSKNEVRSGVTNFSSLLKTGIFAKVFI